MTANSISNPEFLPKRTAELAEQETKNEHVNTDINPIDFIDGYLVENGVEADKVDTWKLNNFITEEDHNRFNNSAINVQMYAVNRVLRLYLGLKAEEDTRAIRAALIDGLPYDEWKELMTDYVLSPLAEHISTGKIDMKIITPEDAGIVDDNDELPEIINQDDTVIVQTDIPVQEEASTTEQQ